MRRNAGSELITVMLLCVLKIFASLNEGGKTIICENSVGELLKVSYSLLQLCGVVVRVMEP